MFTVIISSHEPTARKKAILAGERTVSLGRRDVETFMEISASVYGMSLAGDFRMQGSSGWFI